MGFLRAEARPTIAERSLRGLASFLLIAGLGFGPSGNAQGLPNDPPTNTVLLPAAPAVLTFRGGAGVFNGTHWGGGPPRGDAMCEGTIRQALGLLDAQGVPQPVAGGQRIMTCAAGSGANVGGVCVNDAACDNDPPCTGGEADCENRCSVVSGLTGNNYKAFNLDVTSFATAFSQLAADDNLYVCGHGPRFSRGPKGGLIRLDNGTVFDGFMAPGFAKGTNRSRFAPYPQLPAAPGAVNAHLHVCYSELDPDGAAAKMHAVDTTLDAIGNVTVAHSHTGQGLIGQNLTLDELCDAGSTANVGSVCADDAACDDDPPCTSGEADCENKCAATVAQRNTAVGAVNSSGIINTRFPNHYTTGQNAINSALPPAGGVNVLQLHLSYGDVVDAGNAPEVFAAEPDEIIVGLCEVILDLPSLGPRGLLAVPLLLAITGALAVRTYARR